MAMRLVEGEAPASKRPRLLVYAEEIHEFSKSIQLDRAALDVKIG